MHAAREVCLGVALSLEAVKLPPRALRYADIDGDGAAGAAGRGGGGAHCAYPVPGAAARRPGAQVSRRAVAPRRTPGGHHVRLLHGPHVSAWRRVPAPRTRPVRACALSRYACACPRCARPRARAVCSVCPCSFVVDLARLAQTALADIVYDPRPVPARAVMRVPAPVCPRDACCRPCSTPRARPPRCCCACLRCARSCYACARCLCALRVLARCVLGRCVCAGAYSRTACRRVSASHRRRQNHDFRRDRLRQHIVSFATVVPHAYMLSSIHRCTRRYRRVIVSTLLVNCIHAHPVHCPLTCTPTASALLQTCFTS